MNKQIESQSSLFADIKKNNKRRRVAYFCRFVVSGPARGKN